MAEASVRYIVEDVEAAIAFYELLGFTVRMHPAPGFAMLERGALGLFLNAPGAGGAGQDREGARPTPGGWNRFRLEVADLDAEKARLEAAAARFRGGIAEGNGGRQLLAMDPSGNLVELFEPKR